MRKRVVEKYSNLKTSLKISDKSTIFNKVNDLKNECDYFSIHGKINHLDREDNSLSLEVSGSYLNLDVGENEKDKVSEYSIGDEVKVSARLAKDNKTNSTKLKINKIDKIDKSKGR